MNCHVGAKLKELRDSNQACGVALEDPWWELGEPQVT